MRFVQHMGSPRNFPKGGLTLPTRRLEYGFQGIVNAKNLRQTSFSPSDGGLACSDRGAIALSIPPPGATPGTAKDICLRLGIN